MSILKTMFLLNKLNKNKRKSKEQLQLEQDKKLRKLLLHAYDHSAYYRRTFEENGIDRDAISTLPLSSFPSINKTILFEHFDEISTQPDLRQEELQNFDKTETDHSKLFQNKYHIVHSSGSTGTPRYFAYDESAWNILIAAVIRAACWEMSTTQILCRAAKGLRILYVAATEQRVGGAMLVGSGVDGAGGKKLYLDVNTPLPEWSKRIREFNPNMIIGYPSAIKILAGIVEKGNISLDVFRVVSCAEPLGASLRHYFEKVFHAKVINFYGASESLALGVESDSEEGMFLFDDLNVIEVENGKTYLTALYNFSQPLIRYELTDTISLQEPDKKSECQFTKAVGLLGRTEDVLWFKNDKGVIDFLHPLAIDSFCIKGLSDYQFRPLSKNSLEMLAETTKTADAEYVRNEVLKLMDDILKEKGLEYVKFSIRFVDEIAPNPITGKKQLIDVPRVSVEEFSHKSA